MKIIYCDGSSLGNPGRGGWGVVALDTKRKKIWEFGGRENVATNNQMELAATIFALKLIIESKSNENVYELRLDSKYVLQGITEWSKNWVKNGWKNSQKKEVLNKEMWQDILKLVEHCNQKKIKLNWVHVYGHSGETWNERVDEIAKSFAANQEIELRKGKAYTG